ncbi:MAG TPA: hypothetical protein VFG76_05320 [Candidatus Polarisedimenticolia bacterium]|nr:hypothetical protein [Candidatus Polarisedimenticolia bacterium]
MKRQSYLVVVGLLAIAIPACANRPPVQTLMVPPRIDLKQHEVIGVVEFGSTSEGKLGQVATRRFTEWARHDQGLVRIVELGPKARALRTVGRDRLDPEALKAIGQQLGVQTILTGQLKVSNVRPNVQILASLGAGHVTAEVDATLEVQMFEASTGASLWNSSATGTRSVGHVSVFSGGKFAFDAADPDRAYGELLDVLVEQVTRDFRVTWQRQ